MEKTELTGTLTEGKVQVEDASVIPTNLATLTDQVIQANIANGDIGWLLDKFADMGYDVTSTQDAA